MSFRKTTFIALCLLLALTTSALAAQSVFGSGLNPYSGNRIVSAEDMAAQIVSETNAERTRYGLKPLVPDSDLTAAARIRAQEIVQSFSHTRPDGRSCFTVSGKVFGENIAKGHNYPAKVMAAWMSSSGHRANILRASYGSIGVCCIRLNGVCYWVQLFGR